MIAGLLAIGIILIASGLKGTNHALGQQVQADFLGQGGFLTWACAVMAIGALGYIPGLRTPSRYLLALLVVVVLVRNGGVWANAQSALQQASSAGPAPPVALADPTSSAAGSGSGSASSGGGTGSAVGGIASDAAIGASIGGPYGAAAGAAYGVFDELL